MKQERFVGAILVLLILASFAVSAQVPPNIANPDLNSDEETAANREVDKAKEQTQAINNFQRFFIGDPNPKAADDFYKEVKVFIDQPVLKQIVGVVFGIWDPDLLNQLYGSLPSAFGITKIAGLIIYFVMWLVFLVVFKDILEIATPFKNATIWAIAFGLVIVASQIQLLLKLSTWGVGFAAALGAFSVWAMLIILLVAFIAALLGSNWLSMVALRLRVAKDANRGMAGAGHAAAAIRGLEKVEKAFEKGE